MSIDSAVLVMNKPCDLCITGCGAVSLEMLVSRYLLWFPVSTSPDGISVGIF